MKLKIVVGGCVLCGFFGPVAAGNVRLFGLEPGSSLPERFLPVAPPVAPIWHGWFGGLYGVESFRQGEVFVVVCGAEQLGDLPAYPAVLTPFQGPPRIRLVVGPVTSRHTVLLGSGLPSTVSHRSPQGHPPQTATDQLSVRKRLTQS